MLKLPLLFSLYKEYVKTSLPLSGSLSLSLSHMSQCVPSWDLDENPVTQPRLGLRAHSNSLTSHVPMLDYEVAELTWENGQLSMHGLGPPRVAKSTWEKPRVGGTLESIVDQATSLPPFNPATCHLGGEELVPWLDHHNRHVTKASDETVTASVSVSVDALVPALRRSQPTMHVTEGVQTCVVGSCSGNNAFDNNRDDVAPKRTRVARVPTVSTSQQEWSSSFSGSATFGMDSRQLTLDTYEKEMGVCGFTSTSMGSQENTNSSQQGTKTTTADEHDSVCRSKHKKRETTHEEGKQKIGGKSSLSTKRSRTAAIHNQSERKRRDKINQRMKTLQKLVPNSSKTDKASMLDEVIEYVKQLQAQVSVVNRMSMSSMMLPMTLQQQQLQMSMMTPMGMAAGMGMAGMGMGLLDIGRTNLAGFSPVFNPTAFMPLASLDRPADRMSAPPSVVSDPMGAFLACQSQPITMEAYSRMAALYQQFNHPPASN